jgi:hypothetical protein
MSVTFKAAAALCFLAAFVSLFLIRSGLSILIVINFLQFGLLFGGIAGVIDRLRNTRNELCKSAREHREALARIDRLLAQRSGAAE